jgi:soluble lytic murein transglycosylase-like protein
MKKPLYAAFFRQIRHIKVKHIRIMHVKIIPMNQTIIFYRYSLKYFLLPCITSILLIAWFIQPVYAGKQAEEPVADAVRQSLTTAIADKKIPRYKPLNADDTNRYNQWLTLNDMRLAKRRKDLSAFARLDILETVYYEASRAGIDPTLVLGLIQVESNFRKYAISHADARGLMQVMPFWTRVAGDGDTAKLFDIMVNLRYGCSIYRLYLNREKGDHFRALGRYNGSLGKAEYPNAVLAAWKQWQ